MTVNSWIITSAKLLFFDNPHFLPGNPHSLLLLPVSLLKVSTIMLKQNSAKRVEFLE